ncbi:hypothetical protein [Nocardia sp. NPDC050718]|uniref:hypothetical protein n=1 Tax=Nocardia sp. NPDC050718 TaxID=3155788 RepID=UPI0033E6FA13
MIGNEDDHEIDPDDDVSQEEGSEPEEQSRDWGRARDGDFSVPTGFARSLLPNTDDFLASIVAPVQERMRSLLPAQKALASISERVQEMASIVATIPAFSIPALNVPALQQVPVISTATQEMLMGIAEQHTRTMEGLRKALGPLFDPKAFQGLNRALLPPNLKEHADEIWASDVHEFVEREGIPLYLVPRGRTALRLLRAKDRAGQRRVLGDCYESLIEDCAVVLEQADHEVIRDELSFALDGLGAMRVGHTRSAQAMFTVTLDTLIYRFYPDRKARGVITNRKKGAGVPEEIDEMGVREAFVWLPIWNAHEEFWKHKGDRVPHYYSRHASVHGVSSRQFSKRNCIQVLMLVTSLIGYADRVAREAD